MCVGQALSPHEMTHVYLMSLIMGIAEAYVTLCSR